MGGEGVTTEEEHQSMPLNSHPAEDVENCWTCSPSFSPPVFDKCSTHSSLRKSKVLDFSVGNWEKVLLLFTRPPGVLYLTLDWVSGFLMAGELEEELNSLLKLQVAESWRSTGGFGVYKGGEKKKECREQSKARGHQQST